MSKARQDQIAVEESIVRERSDLSDSQVVQLLEHAGRRADTKVVDIYENPVENAEFSMKDEDTLEYSLELKDPHRNPYMVRLKSRLPRVETPTMNIKSSTRNDDLKNWLAIDYGITADYDSTAVGVLSHK